MALVQWKSELDTGIETIDAQHRRLVELVNLLHRDVVGNESRAIVARVLTELMSYANTHFAEEERLMQECNDPGYEVHRAEHDKFAAKLRSFLQRLVDGRPNLQLSMLIALRDWFVDHVSRIDLAYVPYFRDLKSA